MALKSVPSLLSSGQHAIGPDSHYWLFCKMLEIGFAIHTGPTERLILDYKIQETSLTQQLPKIKSSPSNSFRLSQKLVSASEYYLYYNPEEKMEVPLLARYLASHNQFIPCAHEVLQSMTQPGEKVLVPVVKLGALRGLHHIKDIACLQISTVNFNPLFEVNPELASRLLQQLTSKYRQFLGICDYWQGGSSTPTNPYSGIA